ncbi:MAG TPA: hypothetical protein VGL72_31455 [Bryobacteraceae bacterium]|jgi:hypothetical protein
MSALILASGFFQGCYAQDNVLPRWIDSTVIEVKPGMRQEFEGYLKQLIAAHKKAGARWFLTFETFAGDTTEYTTIIPVMKFGDLDGPTAVAKISGEKSWHDLSRKMARCYTRESRQFATPQAELEISKPGPAESSYWVQTNTLVTPGRMGDYLNWIRNDYRPALEKAGVTGFQVSQPIFGAPGSEIVTLRELRNLGEIDGGAVLSRALSNDDARAVASRAAALVTSSHTRIVRVRTDLSFR